MSSVSYKQEKSQGVLHNKLEDTMWTNRIFPSPVSLPTFANIYYWLATHCFLGNALLKAVWQNWCSQKEHYQCLLTLFVKGPPILSEIKRNNAAQFWHFLYSLRKWYCNRSNSSVPPVTYLHLSSIWTLRFMDHLKSPWQPFHLLHDKTA